MPTGLSLHIGLNSVDGNHYDGWTGPLRGCEADANDMEALAKSRGFATHKLLTKAATASAVRKQIADAAAGLSSGDIFLLTYSGHGGRVPDANGDEDDGYDETWVLYDRELLDDEIYAMWSAFRPGVRVLVLSDSCHSGTVIKYAGYSHTSEPVAAYRAMPVDVEHRVWNLHQKLYTALQVNLPYSAERGNIGASVLLISGCQDWQLSLDGASNGVFTATLKKVWSKGTFKGDYLDFHQQIWSLMPPTQKPNLFRTGAPNPTFEKQTPFTI